ncbi:transketolase family protein [Candidatus Woesearchaeota archaeon]|nr:transketolase family protein [Candidatus Woesearchaeota archaeon]
MLAKDLFDNPGKNSTRQALGDALVALGEMNKDLVVLTADLADSTRTSLFEKAYPDRFFNVGIAEQNMLGIAAGLSFSGKTPFATTFGIFATGRAWDQLRTSICYPRANVKVAATHCGITVGEDGATHQSLSDIALTRTIPNLVVLSPCDYNQAKKAVIAAAEMKGPVYIRLGRPNIPLITTSDTPFQVGKAQEMIFGKDVVIMATGELVYEALAASKILLGESIKAGVLNVHTIKPLDEDAIRRAAVDSKLVVTAEDHHVKGGLGSAVAEVLSSMQGNNRPHQLFIGVKDVFGKSGSSQELMKEFKLTSSDICEAVRKGMRMRAQR